MKDGGRVEVEECGALCIKRGRVTLLFAISSFISIMNIHTRLLRFAGFTTIYVTNMGSRRLRSPD